MYIKLFRFINHKMKYGFINNFFTLTNAVIYLILCYIITIYSKTMIKYRLYASLFRKQHINLFIIISYNAGFVRIICIFS